MYAYVCLYYAPALNKKMPVATVLLYLYLFLLFRYEWSKYALFEHISSRSAAVFVYSFKFDEPLMRWIRAPFHSTFNVNGVSVYDDESINNIDTKSSSNIITFTQMHSVNMNASENKLFLHYVPFAVKYDIRYPSLCLCFKNCTMATSMTAPSPLIWFYVLVGLYPFF